MPARHPPIRPEQAGASAPLAIRRAITHREDTGRPDNSNAAFVLIWLLRVSGVVSSTLYLYLAPLIVPRSPIV
jgi:hypothetical protein